MLDPTFGAAFIDGGTQPRVLGVTLRPFSLWNLFLLQAVESPFINCGDVTLFHLKTAIGICQLRYGNSRIRRNIFPLRCKQEKLERGVADFLTYVGDYLHKPDFAIHTPDSGDAPPRPKRGAAPEPLIVVADVVGWSNERLEDVWNMPIGQAYCYQSMAIRARGADIDFVDPEEREFQRQLTEHLKKKQEEPHARCIR